MNDNDTTISGAPEKIYSTAAHRMLGMTHDEALAELASHGITEADALASFDRVLAKARARLPKADKPAIAPRRPTTGPQLPLLVSESVPRGLVDRIAFHEQLVCAGRGLGDVDAELRRSTLGDFFGRQDWDAVVAARVAGCSMQGEHIKDGDTVLVDTRRTPRDGDIVLAHLADQGQMVKRLRRDGPLRIVLESANSDFDDIVVDEPSTLTIHGVVVGRSGKI